MTVPLVAVPLTGYARLLHTAAGHRHHVASPLGAWLLLALAAAGSRGATRAHLAEVLGVDVTEAAEHAAMLLEHPHPAVAAAAGLWVRQQRRTADLDAWAAGLPTSAGSGEIPDQATLDEWARRHSLGLIDRFPVEVTPETLLVLATALATRVTWRLPFGTAPVGRLGRHSAWAGQVRALLSAGQSYGHSMFVAATGQIGDVAVHVADASQGLRVYSVAADRGVLAADVLDAAHRVALADVAGQPVTRRSLFDLPLGERQLWSVSERTGPVSEPGGTAESFTAVLPAWSARSEHQLGRQELGFPAAAAGLAGLLGIAEFQFQARQAAAARCNRFGFEAAAISAMSVLAGSVGPRGEGRIRSAELRFAHPYAVVAVAVDQGWYPGRVPETPWHGLPVFSAWVAEADEPDEATPDTDADGWGPGTGDAAA